MSSDGSRELAEQLRPRLFRLYYLLRRQTPGLTLTLSQSAVLVALTDDGPQRMSALAEREGVRLPTMTDIVARLCRDGYVVRERDPDDARAVVVSLTEQGRALLADVVERRNTFLTARLEGLPATERAALLAALPALDHLIEPGAAG